MAVIKAIALVIGFLIVGMTIGVGSYIKGVYGCGIASSMSVQSATGTGIITVSTAQGQITSLTASQVPSGNPPPNQGNNAVNLPHGLIDFTVSNVPPNQMITITIQFPSIPQGALYYYKLNPNNNQWIVVNLNDVANPNGYFTVNGSTVTLFIRDNGTFDFDAQAGVIRDPGGIAIAGSGGGQQNPDFSFTLSPTSGSTTPGGSVNTTATINAINGFTGTVNVSLINAPTGVSVSPTSINVNTSTVTQQLTISTSSSTPTGTYTMTVRMASGSLIKDQQFTLTVNQNTGTATATYSWSVDSVTSTSNTTLSSNTARNPSATITAEGISNVIGYQTMSDARVSKTKIPATYKIFFVGDINNDINNLTPLKNAIQAENPDLIILLGDYIYGFTSTSAVDTWYNNLIPTGFTGKVIAVPGNHDVFATVEGGTGSPGSVNRSSTGTQPSSNASLETYLFKKLGMTPNGTIVFKDANVAVLGVAGATRGPASGAPDTTDTTYDATTMSPLNKASLQYIFAKYWSNIIKNDASAEWKIFSSHYQVLGWNTSSAGRDRNDLRFYYLPLIYHDPNNPNDESFDLILSGHIHGWGRSKAIVPTTTAPHFADVDTVVTGSYSNNGTLDFTNKEHGIIQIIDGRGQPGGTPNFNYSSYPLTAFQGKDFSTVAGASSHVGYSTITINNTDTSTQAVIKSYAYNSSTATFNLIDTITLQKNRRYAGDMHVTQVVADDAATTFPGNHTNFFDPMRRNGVSLYTPDASNANVNAISSQNITISAWVYWKGTTKDPNGWNLDRTAVSFQETLGERTGTTDLNLHAIVWTGDPRNEETWLNTANALMIRESTGGVGKLFWLSEDRQGNNWTANDANSSTANIPTNQWVHVAVTVADGGASANDTVKYYINGTLNSTKTVSISGITAFRDQAGTSDPLLSPFMTTIGHDNIGARWFNGYIANTVVFNRTLSDAEISTLYNNPNTLGSLGNDTAIIYKAYFPSGNVFQTNDLNTNTLKDKNTTNGAFATVPRWFNVVSGNINTAISLNVNTLWLYGDSETFPLFIGGILIISTIFNDITRLFRKIIPEVKEAYAQVSNQAVCSLIDVVPIIAVVMVVIAGVFLLVPRGGSGGGGRGL
jgi:hypothetical protein